MVERVGQTLGNYQLLRLLGRGAFAEVYLAEHRYLEVPAAIKVLYVRMEPDTQEQFLREARTIAHLQHPHIVRVYDFGFQDETPYLVMEYTPNGTLRERHPKGTRLSLEQIIHYLKQIAPALDYAHGRHVIHRDIKPENLLLNINDEVVLSDFGIAVVQQSRDSLLTQNQAGTPVYMAPEQIRGKPTAASDQYALGVLVYEWLCGEPPFRGTLFEVLSQHLHEPPPNLCDRVPSLPFAVEDAVFGALAKQPQGRFISVQEFAEVLEAVCDATQPLLLSLSSAPLLPEPFSPPDLLPAPPSAPSLEEPDPSLSTTHTLVVTRTHAAAEEERVSLSRHEATPVSRTNRQRLLKKVRTFWISGVLEHSLHGNALVALGLQEQPDALANPWQLVLHHPTGSPRSLPAGTRITEAYDGANGELLILGAPGSGKTTLLLELTRDLLDRAEHDEQHPMPVLFNLSSWASKPQRLADWLVEELSSTYQVPRKLGQVLVEADQILPLLDGLDEVAPRERTACIEAINTYRGEHGLLPLVVCSRSADYLAQAARVRLSSAVAVQPLTEQQVNDSLVCGGEPLRALRVIVQQDAALRELTSTPLMLSLLVLTYHGTPVADLVRGASLPELQRQIFAHYVERMLKPRGTGMRSTPAKTMRWLAWLARRMTQQNQSVFYIEHLQPTWLSGSRMLRVYSWLAVRLPGMLMGALASLAIFEYLLGNNYYQSVFLSSILLGGFLGGLLSEGSLPQRPIASGGKARSPHRSRLLPWLWNGALVGLGIGLIFWKSNDTGDILQYGLGYGLIFWLCSLLLQLLLRKSDAAQARSQTPSPAEGSAWRRLIRRRAIRNGLFVGLLVVLSYGLSEELSDGLISGLSHWLDYATIAVVIYALYLGLNAGLSLGLSVGVLSIVFIGKSAAVQPTDLLVWSWRGLGKSLFSKALASATVVVIVLVGLINVLVYILSNLVKYMQESSSSYNELLMGLSDALSFNLGNWLSSGLASGLLVGLSYWLLLGLFQGVSSATIEDQRRVVPNQGIRRSALNGLVLGLITTVIVGLLGCLSYGLSYVLSPGFSLAPSEVLKNVSYGLSDGLTVGLVAGLSAGLFVGLLKGGLASFRHSVLRFLLWRTGSVPWHYAHFLDEAAERILLRKVGGGYIFIHRSLLEYFASLESIPTPDDALTHKQRVQPVP